MSVAAVASTSIEHDLSRVLLSDLYVIAECDQDGTVNLNYEKIKKIKYIMYLVVLVCFSALTLLVG